LFVTNFENEIVNKYSNAPEDMEFDGKKKLNKVGKEEE